jgi:hypothetical protein
MSRYLLQHCHRHEECGGHAIWWTAEADTEEGALRLLPDYVAVRTTVTCVSDLLWHPDANALKVSAEGDRSNARSHAAALSMPSTSPSRMPPRDEHCPHITARAHELSARRRYQATIAAALESLRHAERRFDESSAAIDVHIHRAVAAVSLRASLAVVSGRERRKADVIAATSATAEVMPA